jgi:hypothetical protein
MSMSPLERQRYAAHLVRAERSLYLIDVLIRLGVPLATAHRANSYMYQREPWVFSSIDATPDNAWSER